MLTLAVALLLSYAQASNPAVPGYEFAQGLMIEEVSECPAGECVTLLSDTRFSLVTRGLDSSLGTELQVQVASHRCDYKDFCTFKTLAGLSLYLEPKLLQTDAPSKNVQTLAVFLDEQKIPQKDILSCSSYGWDPAQNRVVESDFSKGLRVNCLAYGKRNKVLYLNLSFSKVN